MNLSEIDKNVVFVFTVAVLEDLIKEMSSNDVIIDLHWIPAYLVEPSSLKFLKNSIYLMFLFSDVFLVSREVEQSLADHDTTKCLAWCHDNRSKLRKLKSNMEFNLRVQEFIELVRSDKKLEAVKYDFFFPVKIKIKLVVAISQSSRNCSAT